MRKTVYILLITEVTSDGVVKVGIGPAHWDMIWAKQNARAFDLPGVSVEIVEREVRGDMPTLRAPDYPLPPH